MIQCTYCSKTVSHEKHLPRHFRTCKVKNNELGMLRDENISLKEELTKVNEENYQFQKKIFDLESGMEISRLKDEISELRKQLLEKPKNVKNVINNYGDNYVQVNILAYGDEPQLGEQNVLQLIRDSLSNCNTCDEVVPKFLKQKHFSQDSTKNIRVNVVADKIETVQRDSKGNLKWKKERKDIQSFCKDLALSAVTELNDVYHAEKILQWKAYNRLRFGPNADPDFKKQNPENQLAMDVKKMIAEYSHLEEEDDPMLE